MPGLKLGIGSKVMQFRPIKNPARFLDGRERLPAGATPLVEDVLSGLICLTPSGRWIRFQAQNIQALPEETQKHVIDVLVNQLGGTSAAMAERLGVSPRTVEAWRSGKAALPPKAAYEIAQQLC